MEPIKLSVNFCIAVTPDCELPPETKQRLQDHIEQMLRYQIEGLELDSQAATVEVETQVWDLDIKKTYRPLPK